MEQIQNILLFIGLSWVLVITPGPDTIYVLTQGISGGKKAGLISAIGVTLGIFVHTIFAALGLSIILKTSAIAFMIVKMVGAGYLIYLGIKILKSKDEMKITTKQKKTSRKIFIQGLISNTLNPKVALFFIAFLPQFIKTNGTEISPIPFLILGTIFALFVMIFLGIIGYFSGKVGQYLKTKNSISKWINKISGSIMILLGVSLFFMKKQ
ncbi:LysE family translocator [Tenacibaculum finnmarkense]|uniref:LysE family translocator n=1 Tax=Tenacibaculum finnmarkense TaxID=2781243 RepID=UPI00230184D0|nr:LysE family translocator [Tenacibaculum finnmarkense]WCC46195.1 LysE family translocator [Tenacibaculum finnmarkense]